MKNYPYGSLLGSISPHHHFSYPHFASIPFCTFIKTRHFPCQFFHFIQLKKTSPMDFSHFRMLGFGWESGFGWELLDCGGGFGLCGCFLVWVGACFLLEIFAGSVLLSFLTRLQVGVLDLVM